MSGEPLRIELLDGSDFETDSVEQERRGGVRVGDLDCDDQRIAGAVHVLVRLDFESGNSLTELGLGGGGVRWMSVVGGGGGIGRSSSAASAEEGKARWQHCNATSCLVCVKKALS